jgi:hypothetical protein
MSDPRTPAQNRRLHQLFAQLNVNDEDKAAAVALFSAGRTTSSAELAKDECKALITHLVARKGLSAQEIAVKKMRSSVLHIVSDLGWLTPANDIDWERLNGWMLSRSVLKKQLSHYAISELPALITQLKQLRKKKGGKNAA